MANGRDWLFLSDKRLLIRLPIISINMCNCEINSPAWWHSVYRPFVQLRSRTDSLAAIMMSTKRLDNFEVVCEWDSCGLTCHNMEELSDHMSLHLTEYIGDNDALAELGEWRGGQQAFATTSDDIRKTVDEVKSCSCGKCPWDVTEATNFGHLVFSPLPNMSNVHQLHQSTKRCAEVHMVIFASFWRSASSTLNSLDAKYCKAAPLSFRAVSMRYRYQISVRYRLKKQMLHYIGLHLKSLILTLRYRSVHSASALPPSTNRWL